MALTREGIVAAALRILDEYGLADLTMRRLGTTLDVKAGALYWHFGNKQSLLAAVAGRVLGEFRPPSDELPMAGWLRAWASALRRTLLAHRDGAELLASVAAMDMLESDPRAAGRVRLGESGLAPDRADAVMQAFWHFVVGHVVEEQTRAQLAELGVLERFDDAHAERQFVIGVDVFVAGAATADVRQAAARPGRGRAPLAADR